MPKTARSPVLKMAQFMAEMTPGVKATVMAIINKVEDHPAVKTVTFFASLDVEEARAILDIIVAAVNERDPDYKKPGRPAKSAPEPATASPVAANPVPPSNPPAPTPQPVADAAAKASTARRGRR